MIHDQPELSIHKPLDYPEVCICHKSSLLCLIGSALSLIDNGFIDSRCVSMTLLVWIGGLTFYYTVKLLSPKIVSLHWKYIHEIQDIRLFRQSEYFFDWWITSFLPITAQIVLNISHFFSFPHFLFFLFFHKMPSKR